MANWWDAAPQVSPFDDALQAEGVTGKVAEIARSIYQQESGSGKNTKTSNAGAVGGMQIIPDTFRSVADKDWSINDPTHNARAGIRYVKQLFEQAGGDPALTAAGYYGGPGGLEKARRGVAVSDPRNPNAPNTLQYGQQVAARLPKERGVVQRAVEGMIPSANAAEPGDWWANAPVVEDEPAPAAALSKGPGGFVQGAGNAVLGAVRGAGSIGATLIAPYDMAKDAIAGKGLSLESNRERRAGIDGGLRELGADTDSVAYKGGRLAGEVAGTAGVGGAMALPLRAVAPRLATALSSGGLSIGQGGTMPTNALLRLAGGAGAGAASAGLVSPDQAVTGAVVGALLPPAVAGAGRVGGAVMGAARGVRNLGTSAGQDRIANAILQASATDASQAANTLAKARPLVPGSEPTMGQAAQDAGLAQLERSLVNDPRAAGALQTRYAAQRAARSAAIDDVAATAPGSGSYYDDITEGRSIFAKEDYQKAFDAGIDKEIAPTMTREIASLMERPSMKAAVEHAKTLAAETGETIRDVGSLKGLDWVKKALDNQISKAGSPGSGIGKADLAALQNTSRDLNSVLEQLSPAYNEANRNFAKMSKQINSMDVARSLEDTYTPAAASFGGTNAREQGAMYMKALRKAQDSVKGATGRNMDLSDAMSTPDIYALENVAKDLARKDFSETAGKATGSPTMQNMLSQHLIREIAQGAGLPSVAATNNTLLNAMLGPVNFAGKFLVEPKVMNRLAELAISPAEAARALKTLPPAQANRLAQKIGLIPLTVTRSAPAISAD